MAISIRIKRGTEANILAATLAAGEMAFATDTKAVYVSDGTAEHLVGKSLSGTFAARPSFGVMGRTYYDSTNNTLWVDTGSAWVQPQIVYASEANIPTADQKAALAGTNGTPAAANKFVTDSDPRLSAVGTIEAHTQAATTITGGAFTAGNYTFPAAASGTTLTINSSTGNTPTLGSELVTNGAFSTNATGWTVGEGWEYDDTNDRMAHIPNRISSISLSVGGTGYTANDVLTIDGGTAGSLGTATVTSVSGGVVTGITLTTGGKGYPTIPSVIATGGTAPSPRTSGSSCYDPVNNQMLVLGGTLAGATSTNELWAYSFAANTWSQLSPSGTVPVARYGAYTCYDSTNHCMWLFGGFAGAMSNLLSKYDIATNTWSTISNATGTPTARYQGAACYDATAHAMFIFGGYTSSAVNDLYKYDISGNAWTQITNAGTAPSARQNMGFAYNSDDREFWIFSGYATQNTVFKYAVASNTWSEVTMSGTAIPSGLNAQRVVYDSRQKCFYMFGGRTSTYYDILYKITTAGVVSNPVIQSGTLPIARGFFYSEYSPTSQEMVIWGGLCSSTGYLGNGVTILLESEATTTGGTGTGCKLNILSLCSANLEQNVGATASNMYQVVFTTTRSAGSVAAFVGDNASAYSTAVMASSTFTHYLYSAGTGNLKFVPSCDFDGSLDAVSCKLITAGATAIQFKDSAGTALWDIRKGSGGGSVHIGTLSGQYASSDFNVGVGDSALSKNTAGRSVAVGSRSLRDCTSGQYNVAVGHNALTCTTTASHNTAVGYQALYGNTSGVSNTALGYCCLNFNTTGTYNVAAGYGTMLYNNYGSYNVAVGHQASYNNVSGNYNVTIGQACLLANITGDNNTAVGRFAGYTMTSGSSNVLLGNQAGYSESGSNKLYISNSNTTTPLIYGEFDNNLLKIKGDVKPTTDDTYDLGGSSNRWDDIYATNSTIQTSDANKKDNITDIDLGLEFINKLRPVSFKWKDYTYTEQVALPIEEEEVEVEYTEMEGDVEVTKTRTEMRPKPQEFEEVTVEKTFRRKHSGLIAQEVKDVLDELEVSTLDFAGYVDTYDNGLALRYEEFIAPIIKSIQELSARVEALEA